MATAPQRWPDHLLSLAEWDALPPAAGHKQELVEGVLLVVPRPAPLHQRAMVRLAAELDRQLPDELTALADVEVLIDPADPPTVRAPDVLVTSSALAEQNPSRLNAADVLLAVEIASPGTSRTDRVTKLVEYADAGIGCYWLIELDSPTTLTAHALVDGDYELLVKDSGVVEVEHPHPLRLDLDALRTRR